MGGGGAALGGVEGLVPTPHSQAGFWAKPGTLRRQVQLLGVVVLRCAASRAHDGKLGLPTLRQLAAVNRNNKSTPHLVHDGKLGVAHQRDALQHADGANDQRKVLRGGEDGRVCVGMRGRACVLRACSSPSSQGVSSGCQRCRQAPPPLERPAAPRGRDAEERRVISKQHSTQYKGRAHCRA